MDEWQLIVGMKQWEIIGGSEIYPDWILLDIPAVTYEAIQCPGNVYLPSFPPEGRKYAPALSVGNETSGRSHRKQ